VNGERKRKRGPRRRENGGWNVIATDFSDKGEAVNVNERKWLSIKFKVRGEMPMATQDEAEEAASKLGQKFSTWCSRVPVLV
jgi:hypothetical protein